MFQEHERFRILDMMVHKWNGAHEAGGATSMEA
jgi:hypothetical protein